MASVSLPIRRCSAVAGSLGLYYSRRDGLDGGGLRRRLRGGHVPHRGAGRHKIGHDPTSEGSGNPGATNIYRLGGRLAGVAVALGDMAKGALPVGVALLLWDRPEAMAAWIGAVAGHVWPAIRRFQGGKGMATAGGGGIVLDPLIGAICTVLFFVMVRITRVAALGSLSVGVTYPVLALAFGWPPTEVIVGRGGDGGDGHAPSRQYRAVVARHRKEAEELIPRDLGWTGQDMIPDPGRAPVRP